MSDKQERRVKHGEATPCPVCGEVTKVGLVLSWYPGTNTYQCSKGHGWQHDIQFEDAATEEMKQLEMARKKAGEPAPGYTEWREIAAKHGRQIPENPPPVSISISDKIRRVDVTVVTVAGWSVE